MSWTGRGDYVEWSALILLSVLMIVKAIIIAIAGCTCANLFPTDRGSNAFERVVLSLCMSIACVMLASVSIIVARLPFQFADYGLLVLAGALAWVWLFSKPKVVLSVGKLRQLSQYWLPMVLFVFHLVLWTTYLMNYPYFSNTEPPDAVWHAEITLSVLRGTFTTPIGPTGFAGGAHILFAFISSYFGVSVILAERVTAAFVESLSVLVAYCLFHRILPSRLAADYASVAFAIIVPAGFVYYANVGAYPNIVGDFFVLASLLVAVTIQARLTIASVVTAVVLESIALISHVSALIFLLLVVGFSLVVFAHFRSQFRGYVISTLGFFLIPIAGVVAAPFLVMRELSYVSFLYLDLHNDLALVLGTWIHNYLFLAGSVNFILIMAAFVWTIVKVRSRIGPAFLTAWFSLLIVLVFIGTQDWRMVLLSFVPGAGLLGMLLSRVQEALEKMALPRIRGVRMRRIVVISLMLGFVAIMAAQGPTAYALGHAFSNGQAARQNDVYDSMIWIQDNTSPKSVVVSVAIPLEYRYLPVVANRSYAGDFQLNSTGIMKLQSSLAFNYIAVSTNFSALNTFYLSNSFRLEYQNPNVVIFLIQT
jgi:hypothetical protein